MPPLLHNGPASQYERGRAAYSASGGSGSLRRFSRASSAAQVPSTPTLAATSTTRSVNGPTLASSTWRTSLFAPHVRTSAVHPPAALDRSSSSSTTTTGTSGSGGTDVDDGNTSSRSSSSASNIGAAELQPRPQVKRPHLAIQALSPPDDSRSSTGSAAAKPRRWHKVGLAEPLSGTGLGHAPALSPGAGTEAGSGTGVECRQGDGVGNGSHDQRRARGLSVTTTPINNRKTTSSTSSSITDRTRVDGVRSRDGDKLQQQERQQQQQRPHSRSQVRGRARGLTGRGQGRGAPAPVLYGSEISAARGKQDEDADEYDEGEDEYRGRDLLGLSDEEVERMVFGSAAEQQQQQQQQPQQQHQQKQKQKQRDGVGNGGGARAAADVVAAMSLPPQLHAAILIAVQSRGLSVDASLLELQLRKLLSEAAAAAAAGSNSSSSSVHAPDGATAILQASMSTVAAVLDCAAGDAAAVLVNYPRYVALSAGEADERLRFLAFQLGLDLGEACEVVRQNPALLLVPSEPLRRKLTALANATGLKVTQAAGMVTLYMFPG